jgi:hypothetical protein
VTERVSIALLTAAESRDEHLRVCLDGSETDRDDIDPARADVLYFRSPVAADAVVAQLAGYPGCVVCAGTALDGTVLLAVRPGAVGAIRSCQSVASLVHALLTWGVVITDGTTSP